LGGSVSACSDQLTNSIILGTLGSGSTVFFSKCRPQSFLHGFPNIGLRHYYLATNTYRQAGTANISPGCSRNCGAKRLIPGCFNPYTQISGDLTLYRKRRATPTARRTWGYYYPALDYTVAT